MTVFPPKSAPPLLWGWAGQALEMTSGDLHVVAPFSGGALVCLIDGLGHGPEAADAARAAEAELLAHPGEDVIPLVRRCHEALRRTRGAVMSIASFSALDGTMTWVGIGNVDGLLLRDAGAGAGSGSHEALAVRGGVVGVQLPPLRPETLAVSPGDTLVMATDGVALPTPSAFHWVGDPQELAESLVNRFAKGTDDAHVVVARCVRTP